MTVKDYSAHGGASGDGIRLGFIAALLLCTVLGVIFIGGFWVGSFIVSDRIAYGVKYRGLDLSGLSRADAENIINRDARQPLAKNALVLVYDKDFCQISPRDIDLQLDTEAVLNRVLAVGREGNIVVNGAEIIACACSGREIQPEISYDRSKLAEKIAPIEKKLSRPVKDASLLLLDGGIIARGKASTGMTIATDEWYEELEKELALRHS